MLNSNKYIGFLAVVALCSTVVLSATAQVVDDGLPSVFDDVGISEKLGEVIPTDLKFNNEEGLAVELGSYFNGEKPVILNFVYHNCPMLCSILLESFTKSLKDLDWSPGSDFDILTISFSALETPDLARTQKTKYLNTLGRSEAESGWHFLTGSEENIFALANSVGFSFKWVESSQEFAHPAGLIFLDGEATVTRYIHGMNYPPEDLRLAINEAAEGRIGTSMDRILLYCYRYDPGANSYVLNATRLMKAGGFFTLVLVGLGLLFFWRRERIDVPGEKILRSQSLNK